MNTVTNKRLLYICCDGGLANRMNAIAGAKVVADQTCRELRIWWPANDCLYADFDAIFNASAFPFNVKIATNDEMLDVFETSAHTQFYNCGTVYGHGGAVTETDECYNICPKDKAEIVVIKAWYRPKLAGLYFDNLRCISNLRSMFRYSTELKSAMLVLLEGVDKTLRGGPRVGVHIRFGDPVKAGSTQWDERTIANYMGSTEIDFAAGMNVIQQLMPDVGFVLTSHNPEIATRLALNNPRIHVLPPTSGRHTREGILNDAAHMFLLGMHSRFILGSHWSQYSQVAAEFNCVPLLIAGQDDIEERLRKH